MTTSRLVDVRALERAFAAAAIVHVAACSAALLLHGARPATRSIEVRLLTPTQLQPPPALSPGGGGLRVENVGPTTAPDLTAATPVPTPNAPDDQTESEAAGSTPSSSPPSTGGSGGGTGGGTGTGSGPGIGSGESGRRAQPADDVIEAPRLRSFVQPDYPASARKKGVSGSVALTVHVTAEGRVDSVLVARGLGVDELNAKAIETAYQVSFEPARKNGVPIAAWVPYTVTFSLDKR